jgi:50S ribosomal subunit-associated GTPase HflX
MFNRERILILNKADKVSKEKAKKWQTSLSRKGEDVVTVSALTGLGIDELKSMIKAKGFDRVVHA